jgi:hypothetical protein
MRYTSPAAFTPARDRHCQIGHHATASEVRANGLYILLMYRRGADEPRK